MGKTTITEMQIDNTLFVVTLECIQLLRKPRRGREDDTIAYSNDIFILEKIMHANVYFYLAKICQMHYNNGEQKVNCEGEGIMKKLISFVLCIVLMFCATALAETTIDLSQYTPEELEALQQALNAAKGAAEAPTETYTSSIDILRALADSDVGINRDKLKDYTAETDPNGILGTVGSYSSKTDFGCTGYADNSDGPVGGTLEYFPDVANAAARFEYLKALASASSVLADNRIYLFGHFVFRISTVISDKEAVSLVYAFIDIYGSKPTQVFDPKGIQTLETFTGDGSSTDVEASIATAEGPEDAASLESVGQETPVATQAPTFAELIKGSKGNDVVNLQNRLKELGFLTGVVDGDFGGQTEKAIVAFQAVNGLESSGIASPELQALLFSSDAKNSSGKTVAAYDPTSSSPIEISKVDLRSSYGMPYVSFSAKNTSTYNVTAFTCMVNYYNAYGELMSDYSSSDQYIDFSKGLKPGKSASISTKDDYSFYIDGAASASVCVTRVMLEDGTDITYDNPIVVEGK